MKYLIYLSVLTIAFSFIPVKSNPPDPNKKYPVTISRTIQEWQGLIQAIGSSDRLSAQFANTLTEEVALSLNHQLSDTAKPGTSQKPK